ncbi:MAG TPA: hypothetical protein VKS20_06860 [Candidatus Acidoferrales bacterium]|nr:hypothetical protein [Candidatus Acidoferrales bacterium]
MLPVTDSEEYAVYDAVLNSEYASSKAQELVINTETVSKKGGPFVGLVFGLAGTGAKPPKVESGTMSDFKAKGKKSYTLERQFRLKMQYVLRTNDELRPIFAARTPGHPEEDGWFRFYRNFPQASGINGLSRVGFNSRKDQALVFLVHQSSGLGGTRIFFVLSKSGGTWKIVKRVVMALS